MTLGIANNDLGCEYSATIWLGDSHNSAISLNQLAQKLLSNGGHIKNVSLEPYANNNETFF